MNEKMLSNVKDEIGQYVVKMKSFQFEDNNDRTDIKAVLKKFDEACNVTNILYERYIFLKR